MALLEGYLWGLALIIFIGPVFFTLLQSTLEFGFKSGFAVAFGIFISDVVCVLLLYGFGASDFFTNPDHKLWIGLAGAAILIGLGLKYAVKPMLNTKVDIKLKAADYLRFFTKGFLVNFVNPFVFVVWMGIIGYAGSQYSVAFDQKLFLGAALLGILTTDTLKAALANRIKVILRPNVLGWAYRVIGVALILFGIRILLEVV